MPTLATKVPLPIQQPSVQTSTKSSAIETRSENKSCEQISLEKFGTNCVSTSLVPLRVFRTEWTVKLGEFSFSAPVAELL